MSVACTRRARVILASAVSATCPSIPAVARPALSCVTRRTLTSVFDQERSISFCRFLAMARSPSLTAVKILPRKRRTASSWARQSMASQVRPSSVPFTALTASNLSLGSVAR